MDIILKYFPNLSEQQISKYISLQSIYNEWNTKINVISRKDIDELYTRHVLHSLAIAKIVDFAPNTKIIDVGTGGGFPGIPLAIMFPQVDFLLNDSIAKKIKVVDEVVKGADIQNVRTAVGRVEKIDKKFDFVLGRAITNFPKFLKLVKNNIKTENINPLQNGIIYLKGGDFHEEIKAYKSKIKIFEIQNFFSESFFETKKVIYYKK